VAAYIISRVNIVDRESMARYMAEAPPTVYAFGGRYLVRGNDVRALEGTWDHERMVVVVTLVRDHDPRLRQESEPGSRSAGARFHQRPHVEHLMERKIRGELRRLSRVDQTVVRDR
jgi:hypothetical protein